MPEPVRQRQISAADPGGEPLCLLTAEGARKREVPIDRLLERGTFTVTPTGYEVRLPASDTIWTLADRFIEEEASCCATLDLLVEERNGEITVLASA